jgi:elongation factor P--(R)-beta-lysine ligase
LSDRSQRWRPSATLATLKARAALLAQARRFFAARSVLEVDTPALINYPVTDVHIHSAMVQLPGASRRNFFLHTSPEFAMKRLLAAGSGDIYQICHVYRGEEGGRLHNAEFTLIEWYRVGWSMSELISEVEIFAGELLAAAAGGLPERIDYQHAVEAAVGLNPLTATVPELAACAVERGLESRFATGLGRDELLDWLMGVCIGPQLGQRGLCTVQRYPASQASLARLDPKDARVALRFELYRGGVELANGFEELAAAPEQQARFAADQRERERRGLPAVAADELLLEALRAGLPPCAGVAVGFDRLLMLTLGAGSLEEVLSFGLERA